MIPLNFVPLQDIAQVLIVNKTKVRAFPESLWCGKNFHPEETLKVERQKASKALNKSTLGYGLYCTRGMYSYTYRVYAKTPNGYVEIGACHKDHEVVEAIRKFHADLGSVKDRVALLDQELAHHDWWCHMSDAPGVCRAGENHMERIKPILASLPTKKAQEVWEKHAPKEFRFPF